MRFRRTNEPEGTPKLQIRDVLDPAEIAEATARAVQEQVQPHRVSVWLIDELKRPMLGWSIPELADPVDQGGVPGAVSRCAAEGAAGGNALSGTMTLPLAGPTEGVLGVLYLEGTFSSPERRPALEAIARDAGSALEAARLRRIATSEKEKSKAILGRIADGVVVTDSNGTISQWNEAAEHMIGCSADEAVGHRCSDVLGLTLDAMPLDCSNGCPLLDDAMGDPVLGHEVARTRSEAVRQPLLVKVEALTDAGGRVVEVVHSVRDITKLREADEAKNLFLATASHELKTPLTVIQGFTDALIEDPWSDEEDRERALDAVRRRSIELEKIVDRLLMSSRIEAGRNEVSVEEVDVVPLIGERVESLRNATRRDITSAFEDDVPPAIADPAALVTVVDHLLDNAVKYSPDGGRVTVSVAAEGARIAVSVADSGVGMTPEQAAACFRKFWQAESSDERRFSGTGIGLYIVQSLVSQMGGEVGVESDGPDAGCTFVVALQSVGAADPLPGANGATHDPLTREPSVIREFMHQLGVTERSAR